MEVLGQILKDLGVRLQYLENARVRSFDHIHYVTRNSGPTG